MQITLNQDEIHTAVEQYVRSQINIAENQTVDIDFTAGRGANGLSATLDIRAAGDAKKPAPAPAKAEAEKPAPKPTPAPVKEEAPKADPEPEVEADAPEEAAPEEKEDKAPPAKPKGPSIFAKG